MTMNISVIQNLKKLQGEMDKVFEKSAKKLYKNFKKVSFNWVAFWNAHFNASLLW